jgi:hypothetical protein
MIPDPPRPRPNSEAEPPGSNRPPYVTARFTADMLGASGKTGSPEPAMNIC